MSRTGQSALMQIESITHRFGGLVAVNDVSFEVAPREIVGLIGPNGAGKTTLFNIISGHIRANYGSVILDGVPVNRASATRCARSGIGRTFQIVKPLTTLTVVENVTVGALLHHPIAVARRKAIAIVERVGMAAQSHRLAGSLTLEARKRLELARALSIEPRILLLDEILAGLNPFEINESLLLIRSFVEQDGLAIIMIEHNLHAVMSLAARIVVLDYGRKIADGTPSDIVQDSKVIAAYLGSDA